MLIKDYSNFVRLSDETQEKSSAERERIAQYGIASEIGSLVAAIKKKELFEISTPWNIANEEIVEELGDIIWYTVMLAEIHGKSSTDIVRCDFESLPKEISADRSFLELLDRNSYQAFLEKSAEFIAKISNKTFRDYQDIAILTSRTSGRDLLHVCLTRLTLYATVMMSRGFPQVEKLIQSDIVKLDLLRCLGMVMWHVAALSKVLDLDLDVVVAKNKIKLNDLANFDGDEPTALHDDGPEVPVSQRLPRQFEVSFISLEGGKLQMFYEGRPLGDELTDNSQVEDGYRFHDCMHLANAAKLGWSPVLRDLMKRKRKYDPNIDESQDGARARIVEEVVVKAVHSEGERVSGIDGDGYPYTPVSLFVSRKQISFSFLKLIKRFVRNLEVENNKYWEWREAIVEGHKIYADLRREKQGTVSVDLVARSIKFDERVCPKVDGPVVAFGSDIIILPESENREEIVTGMRKSAILRALGLDGKEGAHLDDIQVVTFGEHISVRAKGEVQERIWKRKIVEFRPIEIEVSGAVVCNVIALTW